MTEQHPITPSHELVEQWFADWNSYSTELSRTDYVATEAARWGADQELEACCGLLQQQGFDVTEDLRAARRPKPPSLKEQALKILEEEPEADDMKELVVFDVDQVNIIRRALEALPE